jgi:hypothetical protein
MGSYTRFSPYSRNRHLLDHRAYFLLIIFAGDSSCDSLGIMLISILVQ